MVGFDGEVWAEIIEVRFAYSGKVALVNKRAGEWVKKWNMLASLDKKILQTELDRQLADYEKTRAEFEIFAKKTPGTSDIERYMKTIQQAELNASVKEVELAKARLDQSDLLSPVDGLVTSTGGCRVGLNVTPASASFQVMDSSSLVFRFKISDDEIVKLTKPVEVKVSFEHSRVRMLGTTRFPIPDNRGGFVVDVELKADDIQNLLPGIKGKAVLS